MDTVPHLTDIEVAAYLGAELSDADRRRIERHLDTCADCRAELVAVHELARSGPAGPRRSWRRFRWWIPAGVAAGLATLVLVRGMGPDPAGPVERPGFAPGEGMPRLGAVTPVDGAGIEPTSRLFTWRPLPAASYRFAVLSADGAPVWTTETADTTVTVPPTVVLTPDVNYFWRVDAVRDGVAATTGVIRFTVVR